jgi:hypothetical protein
MVCVMVCASLWCGDSCCRAHCGPGLVVALLLDVAAFLPRTRLAPTRIVGLLSGTGLLIAVAAEQLASASRGPASPKSLWAGLCLLAVTCWTTTAPATVDDWWCGAASLGGWLLLLGLLPKSFSQGEAWLVSQGSKPSGSWQLPLSLVFRRPAASRASSRPQGQV